LVCLLEDIAERRSRVGKRKRESVHEAVMPFTGGVKYCPGYIWGIIDREEGQRKEKGEERERR
jgi:hypothetical protein